MEWTESLKKAISYMEEHLLEDITAEDVASEVYISSFYLQKGFRIMTDYSIGEYIRNRRLYLAALDLVSGNEKIIDIAYKYGYDTPESFTKAFHRFHGASPAQIKKDTKRIKTFLPLKIKVSLQGGSSMDYNVERLNGFKVIGFEKEFSFDNSYEEIPKFWCEFVTKYGEGTGDKKGDLNPEEEIQKVVCENNIGEYGVCIDIDSMDNKFRYMIAGKYLGGPVPKGLKLFEFPDMDWAKFRCTGPMPGALQTVNTQIFQEWLPGNTEYDIAMEANIEWYSMGDMDSKDYESGIWVPIIKK